MEETDTEVWLFGKIVSHTIDRSEAENKIQWYGRGTDIQITIAYSKCSNGPPAPRYSDDTWTESLRLSLLVSNDGLKVYSTTKMSIAI
jgi:hypothetical protein